MVKEPPLPTVSIAYIYVSRGGMSEGFARHFVESYRAYPPGIDHQTTVVFNGGAPPSRVFKIFEDLGWRYHTRSNEGWDIGGYQDVARRAGEDLLVCFGESVYFWKPGWLRRIAEAWQEFGSGMYGFYSSYMNLAHLNTTAFAVTPSILRQYPPVHSHEERYAFEHGPSAFWRRVSSWGFPARLVTWDGTYGPRDWRKPPNILWRGDQSNCLVKSNHTDRYFAASSATKWQWEQNADRFAG